MKTLEELKVDVIICQKRYQESIHSAQECLKWMREDLADNERDLWENDYRAFNSHLRDARHWHLHLITRQNRVNALEVMRGGVQA